MMHQRKNTKGLPGPEDRYECTLFSMLSLNPGLVTVSDKHVVDEVIVEINDNVRPKYSFAPAFTAGVATQSEKAKQFQIEGNLMEQIRTYLVMEVSVFMNMRKISVMCNAWSNQVKHDEYINKIRWVNMEVNIGILYILFTTKAIVLQPPCIMNKPDLFMQYWSISTVRYFIFNICIWTLTMDNQRVEGLGPAGSRTSGYNITFSPAPIVSSTPPLHAYTEPGWYTRNTCCQILNSMNWWLFVEDIAFNVFTVSGLYFLARYQNH